MIRVLNNSVYVNNKFKKSDFHKIFSLFYFYINSFHDE